MPTENLPENTINEISEINNRGIAYKIKDAEARVIAKEARDMAEALTPKTDLDDPSYLAHYNFRIQQIMSEATTIVDGKAVRPLFAVTNIDANLANIYALFRDNGKFCGFEYLFMHPKSARDSSDGKLDFGADSATLKYILVTRGVKSISDINSYGHVIDLSLFTGGTNFPELTTTEYYDKITKILVPKGRKKDLVGYAENPEEYPGMTNWVTLADKVEEVETW